jgi:NAD(P)-dependent dehydrogenase (short-subunit alcohol dehydrogenase family)
LNQEAAKMRLAGKAGVVIGASRGMGKQMALRLAMEGADVAVAARTDGPGQSPEPGTIHRTAEEIRAMGRRAVPIRVDLAIGEDVDAMCREAIKALGRVDILIHSIQHRGAGYLSLFEETTIEQLDLQVAVNLMSAVRACKIIVPQMKSQGGGIIILVTSAAGELDAANMPGMPGKASTGLGYPMTKAAQIRFMMSLAKEVRPDNIAVIGLDPGFVFSEHVEVGRVGHRYQGWDSRLALPMDVPAETARYLCTCADPMWYSAKNVRAADFVQEHYLWSPAR